MFVRCRCNGASRGGGFGAGFGDSPEDAAETIQLAGAVGGSIEDARADRLTHAPTSYALGGLIHELCMCGRNSRA
jgi:hypothetical protein